MCKQIVRERVALHQPMKDFDPLRSGRITAAEFTRCMGMNKLALPARDVQLLSSCYQVPFLHIQPGAVLFLLASHLSPCLK